MVNQKGLVTREHDPEISEDDGPNINNDIYHQGGGGHFEAEVLGQDNAEGVVNRDIIAENMWRDYQDYIADEGEYEETEASEEE